MLIRCSILLILSSVYLHAATSVSQYGITWTFDKDYEIGQYCSGDYWVVGPVVVTSISNNAHSHGFDAEEGHDGSMINPQPVGQQGYDKRIGSYKASLNVSYQNGQKISAENPLALAVNSSLISSISWLANSDTDKEPGCPKYNGGTKAPRPVLRDAAILTVVSTAPESGSFRPPYCGSNKESAFNKSQLNYDILPNLKPLSDKMNIPGHERRVQRPWIEHGHQYLGAMIHPTNNMPEYGRDLSTHLGITALILLLDFDQLADKPSKEKLMVGFVQIGIDFAGIADSGGSWPSNGGHLMGRKWPILFAGLVLGDEHMKKVGQWKTDFQEDLDTFYVSQAEIDMTRSDAWKPDKRTPKTPYEESHIGLPEWGIRHRKDPWADNLHWSANYRTINNMAYTGFVLAAHIMDQKKAWNHDPLFDYLDRVAHFGSQGYPPGTKHYATYGFGHPFVRDMWKRYRSDYGCIWKPSAEDIYSTGALSCDACKFNCPNKESEKTSDQAE